MNYFFNSNALCVAVNTLHGAQKLNALPHTTSYRKLPFLHHAQCGARLTIRRKFGGSIRENPECFTHGPEQKLMEESSKGRKVRDAIKERGIVMGQVTFESLQPWMPLPPLF